MENQNISSENVVYDFATMQEVIDLKSTYPAGASFGTTSWRCLGGGIVARHITYNGKTVGEEYAGNGTHEDVGTSNLGSCITTEYRPEMEEKEYICCQYCGDHLCEMPSDEYMDENPNGFSIWMSQIREQHECNQCPDCKKWHSSFKEGFDGQICPDCGCKIPTINYCPDCKSEISQCNCVYCECCGQLDCCCSEKEYADFKTAKFINNQKLQPITLDSVVIFKPLKNAKQRKCV